MAESEGQESRNSESTRPEPTRVESTNPEPISKYVEQRPWGSFTILDEGDNYKVKRIEVLPGKRLSYQKHARRSEHWMVVKGVARVTLDGEDRIVQIGEVVDVPVGVAHRTENPADDLLVFIEIQRGDYLGEDDIVRLQDDYGRLEG
jgi:mannose-6-phosphate isomerase-like protein (cupin superfamily)